MPMFSWLRRSRLDLDEKDFADEVRAHLAMAEDERIAAGADRQTAHDAARRDFGNILLTTEAARRVWTPRWLETVRDLASDVRYAIRALMKTPAFSLTVVAVLTLGIGLNAAVFTMLKGIALTPLAGVDGSARLAVMFAQTDTGRRLRVSYPDYQYLRDHVPAFADLMGTSLFQAYLGKGRSARVMSAELVTGNYFCVLGVRAQLGRTILPSDEVAPGRHPVVVLSDGLWRRDFGADPGIIGKTVEVNNYPLTVVGVAAPAFHGTIVSYDVEAFVPVTMMAEMGLQGGRPATPATQLLADREAAVLFPHAFLAPGASLQIAAAQTDAAWATLSRERSLRDATLHLKVVTFRQAPTGGQAYILPTILVLSAMGLLVLLIACANIAGLVLVRGVSRRGEIAVRMALGAPRSRIVRLLVLENLVLAAPGATLGLLLSWQGIPPMMTYAEWLAAPQRLYLNGDVDGLVIGFAALVACGCVLVFGLVPALQSSRVDLVSVINGDASARSAARGRMRSGLVVAQVAVSLLLLVGAGMTARSLDAARRADPGFERDHVTALGVDVKQNGYDEARGRLFYRRLLDTARAGAGVESATLATLQPLAFLDTGSQRVAIEGYEPKRGEDLAFLFNVVGPDYLRTLRIGLVAGREFEERDDEMGAPVVVVNNTLADTFWGGAANAIGKRVRVGGTWRLVVGVAADVKYLQINESPRPYLYLPVFQSYRSDMMLHTRGPAPVDALAEQARGFATAVDPELPILFARPLTELTIGAFLFLNLMATMLLVFGGVGMALAALGTYGLVSYTVKQSSREIGIRMALGATGPAVVRVFFERGLRLGAIGAVLGIVVALSVTRLIGSVLYGVSAVDGVSFARALAIVLGGVIVATIVPAWRASRTDPLRALRQQ